VRVRRALDGLRRDEISLEVEIFLRISSRAYRMPVSVSFCNPGALTVPQPSGSSQQLLETQATALARITAAAVSLAVGKRWRLGAA
jgi:hypothetical protein